MLILYSKIINKPIISLKETFELGRVSEVIFDPKDFTVNAFVLKPMSFSFKDKFKVAPFNDVVKIFKEGVFVSDVDSITELNENPKIKKLADDQYFGIHQIAIDENKKVIGRVADFVIDTETGAITKLYTKYFVKEKIFETKLIREIKKKRIMIETSDNRVALKKKEADCTA